MSKTSTQQTRAQEIAEATPVLIHRTGTIHLGVCDRTLCGVWIGEATFGDYEVDCASCERTQALLGWGCVGCGS